MGSKGKILITDEGHFDLTTYKWDDQLFSDILAKDNLIESDQAMSISRFLRKEIANMENHTITLPIIDKMIQAKLMEYGLTRMSPIRLDKSIFIKNGLNLSNNAINVLNRRYLKKDSQGKIIENPEKMFRRVAKHIAKAERKYGSDADEQKMENIFYNMMTDLKFLPNSPTLMNAGRRLGQLAACPPVR